MADLPHLKWQLEIPSDIPTLSAQADQVADQVADLPPP